GPVSQGAEKPGDMMDEKVPASQAVDLGVELRRCRPLSGARTLQAQGYALWWPLFYIVYPLIILPYLAFMGAVLPFLALGYSFEEMFSLPSFAVLFACFYAALCWWGFILPRYDHLAVHERGLRVKLGFKRREIPFDSIEGIYTGRPTTELEERL